MGGLISMDCISSVSVNHGWSVGVPYAPCLAPEGLLSLAVLMHPPIASAGLRMTKKQKTKTQKTTTVTPGFFWPKTEVMFVKPCMLFSSKKGI